MADAFPRSAPVVERTGKRSGSAGKWPHLRYPRRRRAAGSSAAQPQLQQEGLGGPPRTRRCSAWRRASSSADETSAVVETPRESPRHSSEADVQQWPLPRPPGAAGAGGGGAECWTRRACLPSPSSRRRPRRLRAASATTVCSQSRHQAMHEAANTRLERMDAGRTSSGGGIVAAWLYAGAFVDTFCGGRVEN